MDKAAKQATGQRLLAAFRDAGALEVAPDILLPAGTLLDLYGEDIRARAYTTTDPLHGEMMLRPDFTVPVVQMHMAHGAEPARYCYLGEVFRKQDHLDHRPPAPRDSEYLQVGYEVFAQGAAGADAEVFSLFHRLLAPLSLTATIGDMGLVLDAVQGMPLTDDQRLALTHHIWRPQRFARLLALYADPPGTCDGAAPDAPAGPWTGLRTPNEMAARTARLTREASRPALPAQWPERLDRLFALTGPAPAALAELMQLGASVPALAAGAARLQARLAALSDAGIDPATILFDASLGRQTLEYYDGFTFTFTAPGRTDWPPVASGGRYDRLTAELGRGCGIPAVGGIIRPGLVTELEARC